MELAKSRTGSSGKGDYLSSVLFKEVHTCVALICVWDFLEVLSQVDFLTLVMAVLPNSLSWGMTTNIFWVLCCKKL